MKVKVYGFSEGEYGFYPPKRRFNGDVFEIDDAKFAKNWMKKLPSITIDDIADAEEIDESKKKPSRGRRYKKQAEGSSDFSGDLDELL